MMASSEKARKVRKESFSGAIWKKDAASNSIPYLNLNCLNLRSS